MMYTRQTCTLPVLAKIISCLPDKMSSRSSKLCRTFWSPCQSFFSVHKRQILNPAGQNVQQGQSPLPDISKTLPDMSGMSGIFREDCIAHAGKPKSCVILLKNTSGQLGLNSDRDLLGRKVPLKCKYMWKVIYVWFKPWGYNPEKS